MMNESRRNNWKTLPPVAPDPILSLMLDVRKDPRSNKVDLTAGVYKDEDMRPFVLTSVLAIVEDAIRAKNVDIFRPLPPAGDLETADALLSLCFGVNNGLYHQERFDGRIARVHCQSGGNGLYFIFELLKKFYPALLDQSQMAKGLTAYQQRSIWCAGDTWPIHLQMIKRHRLHLKAHRYYNAEKNTFDFEGMFDDLQSMKEGDILFLQPAGHNPTGYDPSKEQWKQLAALVKQKGVQVIFDFAYMGYSSGDIDEDCFAVRHFLEQGIEFYLTIACSKNFGLYSARVGALAVRLNSPSAAEEMRDYLIKAARLFYGGPNAFGAHVVKRILTNSSHRALWLKDLGTMTGRIRRCRSLLLEELQKTGSKRSWDFITRQFGMFAYTGLTEQQVKRLKQEYAIFLIDTGRISITGLNSQNCAYVARAFHEVTK